MKNYRFSKGMANAEPSAVREMYRYSRVPGFVSLAGGNPDPRFFPVKELMAANSFLAESTVNFQYSMTDGYTPLREEIIKYQKTIGIEAELKNVLITTGGQQAMDLAAKVFIDHGDSVMIEAPTYMGALNALYPFQPKFVQVKMDDDGLNIDDLKKKLKEGVDLKMIYTIPDFQNPTGLCMSEKRRHELVELANEYEFLIIEDNPYYELRFAGKKLPTLKSLDTEGNVIFIGSFSKTICPGIRVGWVCAEEPIVKKFVIAKQAADLESNGVAQRQVAYYLSHNDFNAHLMEIREGYRVKKERMIDAIEKYMPKEVKYTNPEGGMFVWLTLPSGVDDNEFMNQCIEEKVTVVPGNAMFVCRSDTTNMRLSYAPMEPDQIEEGIKRVAKAYQKIRK